MLENVPKTTFEGLWRSLLPRYDEGEARAVVRWLLEVSFGLSMTDIVCGAIERLTISEQQRLHDMHQRLLEGEPVQYVAGVADFGPRQFRVAPGVLIPRTETYELCQWVKEECGAWTNPTSDAQDAADELHTKRRILDIGTGSGCIACTLAADFPAAEVTAWDISPVALGIAKENARRAGVNIAFEQHDMLQVQYGSDAGRWDVIVSNPPYICDSEADDMADWVLDYEPEIALFVPDDDPLLFYLHISNYAQSALKEGGLLFFEINPLYDEHIEDILLGLGFDDIEVREDQFGKNRFIKARWH